jgi:serine/threonine protein kinase
MEQPHEGDPTLIGPYRVIALLGSGGMGKVYLCTSPGGRRLAVKVIRPELAEDPQFRARFRREVATAKLVRSHVTAAVVDADTESPTPWLATIYLEGPTLSAVVEQAPLAEPELRRLAAALAEALQFIHGAGLVHRDLKPSNIILASDGPRVIDFGIARAADATALTTTNLRIGSPGYMAPEQIRTDATGPETDIFALGAVLAYAATGRSPFGSGPTDVVLYRVLHEEPDLSDVPPTLRSLIATCLAKDPGQRPTPDLILQETTGNPATLVLTQALSPEHASLGGGDALTRPVGVAATRRGIQVSTPTGLHPPNQTPEAAAADHKKWRTPIAWAILPLLIVAVMFGLFYLGNGSKSQNITGLASGKSSVLPTRPASPANTASATTAKTSTPSPTRSVTPAPRTAVQITRWGHATTPPKETVYLSQPDGGCPQSNVLARQDAFRCYTTPKSDGGNIADPCFPMDDGTGAMCPSAPWSTEWVFVSFVGNGPVADPPTSTGLPWAIEIASGVRCTQMGGATAAIGDKRMNYACPNGSYLWGDPSRGSTWHIDLSTKYPGGSLHSVAIREVWF